MSKRFGKRVPGCECTHSSTCRPCLAAAGPTGTQFGVFAPTQVQMFYQAERRAADRNEVMLDLLYGPNPITDAELEALIKRRPELETFRGYIGKRGAPSGDG